jgi:hypothetical protein
MFDVEVKIGFGIYNTLEELQCCGTGDDHPCHGLEATEMEDLVRCEVLPKHSF